MSVTPGAQAFSFLTWKIFVCIFDSFSIWTIRAVSHSIVVRYELFDWEQITSRNGRVNLCVCSAFLLQTHVMETSSPIPYRLEPVEIEVIKVLV